MGSESRLRDSLCGGRVFPLRALAAAAGMAALAWLGQAVASGIASR